MEIFFETLLVLVCVGVLAFAGLTVKKLYQGQRDPHRGTAELMIEIRVDLHKELCFPLLFLATGPVRASTTSPAPRSATSGGGHLHPRRTDFWSTHSRTWVLDAEGDKVRPRERPKSCFPRIDGNRKVEVVVDHPRRRCRRDRYGDLAAEADRPGHRRCGARTAASAPAAAASASTAM